uniref:Leucine-rich repeat protein (LRRP) n=1 Tax=Trypanosoma vivax (strain Y486) TaxID=1055687 RepID=G0U1A4_TRYVY|nr:conserved hypothetical protein [Trypanosoma vivax Y486]
MAVDETAGKMCPLVTPRSCTHQKEAEMYHEGFVPVQAFSLVYEGDVRLRTQPLGRDRGRPEDKRVKEGWFALKHRSSAPLQPDVVAVTSGGGVASAPPPLKRMSCPPSHLSLVQSTDYESMWDDPPSLPARSELLCTGSSVDTFRGVRGTLRDNVEGNGVSLGVEKFSHGRAHFNRSTSDEVGTVCASNGDGSSFLPTTGTKPLDVLLDFRRPSSEGVAPTKRVAIEACGRQPPTAGTVRKLISFYEESMQAATGSCRLDQSLDTGARNMSKNETTSRGGEKRDNSFVGRARAASSPNGIEVDAAQEALPVARKLSELSAVDETAYTAQVLESLNTWSGHDGSTGPVVQLLNSLSASDGHNSTGDASANILPRESFGISKQMARRENVKTNKKLARLSTATDAMECTEEICSLPPIELCIDQGGHRGSGSEQSLLPRSKRTHGSLNEVGKVEALDYLPITEEPNASERHLTRAANEVQEINRKTMEVLGRGRASLAKESDSVATGEGGMPCTKGDTDPCKLICPARPFYCSSEDRAAAAAATDSCLLGSATDEDAAILQKFLHVTEVDLSLTTFKSYGATLSMSQTLRFLNLKGCAATEDDLVGLAEVETLEVVCVSNMRNLRSLAPLALKKSGLTSNIREIDARCSSVGNEGLAALGSMHRLEVLNLNLTLVTDVSFLSSSSSLVELYLAGTAVTSNGIVGLGFIPTLKVLDISRTKVRKLCDIVQSTSLESLTMYSCKASNADLCGLEKMPRLTTLDISTTGVSNLSFLGSCPALTTLKAQWLYLVESGGKGIHGWPRRRGGKETVSVCSDAEKCNALSSAAAQEGCVQEACTGTGICGLALIPTLKHVDLSYGSVKSIRCLFASRSIETILLRRTQVGDASIRGISQLQSLRKLVVGSPGEFPTLVDYGRELATPALDLTSLRGIVSLVNLVVLDLSYTDVFDLRVISGMKNLEELYLVETMVTHEGLWGIQQLPSLHVLDVSQTSLLSLHFLSSGCSALRRILARSNRNTRGFRIGGIHCLPSLEELDVSDTVVEDIHMLMHYTCSLKRFIWRWGERRVLYDPMEALAQWVKPSLLDGIACLRQLELIDLSGCAIKTVSFLSASLSLKRVILMRCNSLTNGALVGLARIPTLEEVDLSYAKGITSLQDLVKCPSLRTLRVPWSGVKKEGLHGTRRMTSLALLDVTGTPAADELAGKNFSKTGRMPFLVMDGVSCSPDVPAHFKRRRSRLVSIVA